MNHQHIIMRAYDLKSLFMIVLVFFDNSVLSDISDGSSIYISAHPNTGYIYGPPHPPVQFEEPAALPPAYLPPIFADEPPIIPVLNPIPPNYLPPSYLPPPTEDDFPPSSAQLHPILSSDDTVVIPALPPQNGGTYPPSQSLLPPQFRIENMSCIQGVNFRATFKMMGDLPQFPVMDDGSEGCLNPLISNKFKIDLEGFNSMLKCGVKRCKGSVPQGGKSNNFRGSNIQGSENMCVVLRLPAVRGVRLPEDGMVTLVCTPQERVVSQTKHLRLGSNRIIQNIRGRSSIGFVATGGTQKDLKSRMIIFKKRPGTNYFDQSVQPDSIIQLGEELLLRAVISDEDGWKSSQIGPVVITGLNSKKSALLVNQNGCVNPTMKTICPHQPVRVSPLSTDLHFRAFLFQESPQGDEMIISVKMQGCLHTQDCLRNDFCKDDSNVARLKRELENTNTTFDTLKEKNLNSISEEVKNWESKLSFRVQIQPTHKKNPESMNFEDEKELYLFYFFVGLIFVLGVIILLVMWIFLSKIKVNYEHY